MNSTYTMERSVSAVRDLPSFRLVRGQSSAGGKESRSRQDETCVGSASDVTKSKSGWRIYSPWTVQPELWWGRP